MRRQIPHPSYKTVGVNNHDAIVTLSITQLLVPLIMDILLSEILSHSNKKTGTPGKRVAGYVILSLKCRFGKRTHKQKD